ncbi:MAG: glycoside hydrolase family 66 protein, partial [Anaerolineae bacterium]|nr:glycoside hydrolase family 66 protein [Anaerolineae bacterium]
MSATDLPQVTILPDKGFYRPGEPVQITVRTTRGDNIEARILYLTTELAVIRVPITDGQATFIWTPPPDVPRGYGLSIDIYDTAGTVITTQTSAFDVLNRWIDAPRYGFLSDFSPARLTDTQTIEWMLQHHINGVQFYDWQYRWEDLLPETDRFEDGLGRPQSMTTIRRLIEVLHAHRIAAMPYTAIYGASTAFYRQHPEWGFFDVRQKVYDFGENSFISIMNPAPGSPWNQHLLGEFADVLENTPFDGIHIDQYGSPKNGYDHEGNYIDLADVMPQFINQTAALVQQYRDDEGVVLFNCVGNWPIDTAAPSEEDAAYIEVWSPNDSYLDLGRIITNAEGLGGGKPVIIPAYIPPAQTINWRLANSVILASGGTHLETGEPESMLADPYFPRFGKLMPEQQPIFRRYYDFQVRYENVLSTTTTAGSDDLHRAVDLGEIRTRGISARNRVVPVVRSGDTFDTFSLINFVGVGET